MANRRTPELEDAFIMLLQQNQKQQISISQQAFRLEQNNNSQSDQAVIVVKDLVRTFGDFTAVANTSFTVQRGEIFGLLGKMELVKPRHSACYVGYYRQVAVT